MSARFAWLLSIVALAACSGLSPPAAATSRVLPLAKGALGNDVGMISCNNLPTGGTFGIIAATAGQPFAANTCLATEYAWANALPHRPQYYINLANPGHKSVHWGKGGPQVCHKKPKYDVGCAFDYGYQTAAAAWDYVRAAGSAGIGRWWLDFEVDNTWGMTKAGIAANIADINGAKHFLRAQPHVTAGVYTETTWWDQITHGTQKFNHLAVWGGGANSKKHAKANCRKHSITGGPALLAQWIRGTIDHDVVC